MASNWPGLDCQYIYIENVTICRKDIKEGNKVGMIASSISVYHPLYLAVLSFCYDPYILLLDILSSRQQLVSTAISLYDPSALS